MAASVWLTWKMHRFEVLFVACLTAVLAVSALIVTSHITGIGLSETCWPRTGDSTPATAACDDMMTRFWSIAGAEGSYLRMGLALVTPIAGLILGVPVVARELETRTTAFAWSLESRRWRWVLSRALPMLLVAIIGFAILGAAGALFFGALATGHETAALTEVGSQGPALMARGLLAFGVALLIGALLGRTMPAFLVAAVVLVAWFALGMDLVQGDLSRQWGVWVRDGDLGSEPAAPIAYITSGQFDTTQPGVDGRPGADFDYDALDRLVQTTCGAYPQDPSDPNDEVTSPAEAAWITCAEPIRQRGDDRQWDEVVPASRFGDYVSVDTVLSLLIGGIAIALTFPVVARRRPA